MSSPPINTDPDTRPDAGLVIKELTTYLVGSYACIAGSVVAAEQYDMPSSYDDVDIFCYGNSSLIAITQHLLDNGFEFDTKNESMKFSRWLAWDLNVGWRTNSVKLYGSWGNLGHPYQVNLVFKQHEKQPVKRLSDVLASFDFGLLAQGYDLVDGEYRDMRSYFFPRATDYRALPLLPDRAARWERGLVTQYTGLRQAGRAVKYATRGYDMSLVLPALIKGYRIASFHHADHFDPEKVVLGQIFDRLADHLEDGEFDKIAEADALLPHWRDVDAILDRLD